MSIETLAAKREIAKMNMLLVDAMHDAHRRVGRGKLMRLFSTLHISADVAQPMKRANGADGVREIGMRTGRAEALLGPGWLDE